MIKVYGFLKPCNEQELAELRKGLILLGDEADSVFTLKDGLLNLAYEGAYFPVEDFLEALKAVLQKGKDGRLDYIDLEAWTLTRYGISDGLVTASKRGLNDALAYSGH